MVTEIYHVYSWQWTPSNPPLGPVSVLIRGSGGLISGVDLSDHNTGVVWTCFRDPD